MNTILIADTLYPEFLKTWECDPHVPYAIERDALLHRCFGTFDAYSRNLRELGWEAIDVILNADKLQAKWEREFDSGCEYQSNFVFEKQIEHYRPDVIFMQDLNVDLPETAFCRDTILAGQCSCPMPADRLVSQYDVLFTSFPHYVPRFESLGVTGIYNPLAFDPIVLDRIEDVAFPKRTMDVVFVGGVGTPSHWRRGMETLETVAREIPSFQWWGYGVDALPSRSPLIDKYRGEAWGLDMYRLFRRAKIVLNRHGEVAEGFANNMRLFEASGCGAAVLTEKARNLSELFVVSGPDPEMAVYESPEDAVEMIQLLLQSDPFRRAIAEAGQRRTFAAHTYLKRMETVSQILRAMCPS